MLLLEEEKEILLANHQRHIGSIYTTLAGFVEEGESLEQTVEREILKVGLKVKNIRAISAASLEHFKFINGWFFWRIMTAN